MSTKWITSARKFKDDFRTEEPVFKGFRTGFSVLQKWCGYPGIRFSGNPVLQTLAAIGQKFSRCDSVGKPDAFCCSKNRHLLKAPAPGNSGVLINLIQKWKGVTLKYLKVIKHPWESLVPGNGSLFQNLLIFSRTLRSRGTGIVEFSLKVVCEIVHGFTKTIMVWTVPLHKTQYFYMKIFNSRKRPSSSQSVKLRSDQK